MFSSTLFAILTLFLLGSVVSAHPSLQGRFSAYELTTPGMSLLNTEEQSMHVDVGDFVLEVKKKNGLFHRNYKQVSMNGAGEILSSQQPDTSCVYQGHIAGEEDSSLATVVTCGGTVRAFFKGASTEHKFLTLEPLDRHLEAHEVAEVAHSHVLYDATQLDDTSTVTCGATDHHTHTHENEKASNKFDHSANPAVDASRRLLTVGECDGNPTKYVEMLIVNDASASAARPNGEAESFAAEVFAITAGFYAETAFACNIELILVAQLTYVGTNDPGMGYRTCDTVDSYLNEAVTGTACCSDIFACADGDNVCISDVPNDVDLSAPGCFDWTFTDIQIAGDAIQSTVSVTGLLSQTADEIDHPYFLKTTAKVFLETHKTDLEALFGVTYDNVATFTYRDFVGDVRGLATLNSQCLVSSNSIEQVTESATYVGTLLAHELGHNFGMSHVTESSIMEAASDVNNPSTNFAADSITALDNFLNGDSASSFSGTCLDVANSAGDWDVAVCGNGRVDPGEDCDNGFDDVVVDACCNSATCMYESNCVCANSEACCTDGAFSGSDVVCREAVHADCDTPDYCSGESSSCPELDEFEPAGTSCGTSGLCYAGECKEDAEVCADFADEWFCPVDPTIQSGIYTCTHMCAPESDCVGTLVYNSTFVDNGVYCWNGCQCVNGNCKASDSIHFYTLVEDSEGTEICVDETGAAAVDSDYCINPPQPDTCDTEAVVEDIVCPGMTVEAATLTGAGCSDGAADGSICTVTCNNNDEGYTYTCTGNEMLGPSHETVDEAICPVRLDFTLEFDAFNPKFADFADLIANMPDVCANSTVGGDKSQFTVIDSGGDVGSYWITISIVDAYGELTLEDDNTAQYLRDELFAAEDTTINYAVNSLVLTDGGFEDEDEPAWYETPIWDTEFLAWQGMIALVLLMFCFCGCCYCACCRKKLDDDAPFTGVQMARR